MLQVSPCRYDDPIRKCLGKYGISDEMNIFIPQSIQTMLELDEIAQVKRQIITPASSVPCIGVVQDGLLGAYNLTQEDTKIDWKDAMNILSYTNIDTLSN